MPPNRKAHFEATRSLASLKLSHTLAAKAPEGTKSQPPPIIDSALYWDWPADTADKQTKKQPPVIGVPPNKDDCPDDVQDNLFSADHIVANLITAAQQLSENKQLKASPLPAVVGASGIAEQKKSEEYWFQPFKHVNIEEIDDSYTSVHNIEAHLIRQAEGSALRRHDDSTKQDGTLIASHSLNNLDTFEYWDWPAWSEKYHEALFSANCVQAGLVRHAAQLSHNSNGVRSQAATTFDAGSDYWAF